MDTNPMIRRYAEYHRKKWYPSQYADPFGEFTDDITEGAVKQLAAVGEPATAALALILMDLLPQIRHRDLALDAERAYRRRISGTAPAAAMYSLRALPEQQRANLWEAWCDWARETQTPLYDWLSARTAWEAKLADARKQAHSCFGMDAAKECEALEPQLRAGRDLFDYELRRHGSGRTLADWLAVFRMQISDALADWNDFPALARNFAAVCRIQFLPSLQHSKDPSEQRLFPVDPPSRVILRYGEAAGPVDVLRFLQELGRAFLNCNMNPELGASERLLGDPALPHFWAYLYGGILTQSTGVARMIRVGAEDLAPRLRVVTHFWNRYDGMLALYHERLASDLKAAEDLYMHCWDQTFAFEPPRFLFLFDLERSGDAVFRVSAFRAAAAVTERLRSLYGNDWFASERCVKRLRDYCHDGYRMRLDDLLKDLDARPGYDFPVLSS